MNAKNKIFKLCIILISFTSLAKAQDLPQHFKLKVNQVEINFHKETSELNIKEHSTQTIIIKNCAHQTVDHFFVRLQNSFTRAISIKSKNYLNINLNDQVKLIPSDSEYAKIFKNIKLEFLLLQKQIERECLVPGKKK